MTAAWPSWISVAAMRDGYSEKPETNVAKFQPDIGAAKLRRRTSIIGDTLNFAKVYSADDCDDIKTFFKATLKDGTLPFTMTHPRTGSAATWVFDKPVSLASALGRGLVRIEFALRLLSGGYIPPRLAFNRPRNLQLAGAL